MRIQRFLAGDTPDTLDNARMATVVRAAHAVAMEF